MSVCIVRKTDRERELCSAFLYSRDRLTKNVLDCWEGDLQKICVTVLLASDASPAIQLFTIAIKIITGVG